MDEETRLYPQQEPPVFYDATEAPKIELPEDRYRARVEREDLLAVEVRETGREWEPGAGVVTYAGNSPADVMRPGVEIWKRTSRYDDAADPNLPEWRWMITDDDGSRIRVRYQLRRDGEQRPRVNWTQLAPVEAEGYNYALRLSGALSYDLAARSGTYILQIEAVDEVGNRAEKSFQWKQTVLPPPVKLSEGPLVVQQERTPDVARFDGRVAALMKRDDIIVGSWRLDNPNETAIVLGELGVDARASWQRRAHPRTLPLGIDAANELGCAHIISIGDVGPWQCVPHAPAWVEGPDQGTTGNLWNDRIELYSLSGEPHTGMVVPARSSIIIVALSNRWTFLADPRSPGPFADEGGHTSQLILRYRSCEGARCLLYSTYMLDLLMLQVSITAQLALNVYTPYMTTPERLGPVPGRGAALNVTGN
jgi:hypothetical protein